MILRYTKSGFLFISPEDDCHSIVDAMLATNYNEEFCIATSFNIDFIVRLMEAGFLVMSANIAGDDEEPHYIVLPKLHVTRSALFYENLHVKKSIRPLLKKYKLEKNTDFNLILDSCVEKHGIDWLTPPLVERIKEIRKNQNKYKAYPASFGLYRDGKLAAGEFGIICGKVYTSYSGFYDVSNAGTVQLILTTRYLQENGFTFFDLGMPMSYKNDLGAVDITPEEFVRLFRKSTTPP